MVAAKAQMANTSHNIANANSEGFTRQRVQQQTDTPRSHGAKNLLGQGTLLARTERLNDQYLEKQIRNVGRDLAHMEEKEMALKQTEDIFNEIGGEGLNRIISKFFNDFRRLSNEPDNTAVREAVRESSLAMANDFRRMRVAIEDVRSHIDARIEGIVREANGHADTIRDLNVRIKIDEVGGGAPNDLKDQRDMALKKLASFMDVSMHLDKEGAYCVDIKGLGPIVNSGMSEKLSVARTPADSQGKRDGSFAIKSSGVAAPDITHALKGGKLGALVEVRDQTLSSIMDRMDELAVMITESVNAVHREGFNRFGVKGVDFFKVPTHTRGAAEFMDLSDAVKSDVNAIATAAIPDAPGDNRIAVAIANIQNMRIMDGGKTSIDDFYNSIVSDVGVVANRNRSGLNQQKDVQMQLTKMRDQISGVSIDEETTNLMQYQHAFDASAKVLQVADECLKTVLDLKR